MNHLLLLREGNVLTAGGGSCLVRILAGNQAISASEIDGAGILQYTSMPTLRAFSTFPAMFIRPLMPAQQRIRHRCQ